MLKPNPLPEIQAILSRHVVESISEEQRPYFYDLINTIPADFGIAEQEKINKYCAVLIHEMCDAGANKDDILGDIDRMNRRYIRAMPGGWILSRLLK